MNSKAVTMYECPISGKLFKSQRGADNHAAKLLKEKEEQAKRAELDKLTAAKKLEQKDYIRLNLRNVADLSAMIKEKAKEFWGVEADLTINVRFSRSVPNSHGAPIGERTNWSGRDKNYPTVFPGWSGQISGKVVVPKNLWTNFKPSANEWLFGWGGFKGFHTSAGCGGDTEGKYPIDIGFYFFLQDFPLLLAQYKEYVQNLKIRADYMDASEIHDNRREHHLNTHPDTIKIEQEIEILRRKLVEVRGVLNKEYLDANPRPTAQYTPNLPDLEKNFGKLSSMY